MTAGSEPTYDHQLTSDHARSTSLLGLTRSRQRFVKRFTFAKRFTEVGVAIVLAGRPLERLSIRT